MEKDDFQRPRFVTSYFEVMAERSRRGRYWRLFPYWLGASFVVGTAVSYSIPSALWHPERLEPAVGLYGSLLTLNGLMVALSWNAFSRIHDMMSEGRFALFLRENNLLSRYIFYLDYVHFAQLTALLVSAVALFSLFFSFTQLFYQRALLTLVIALAIYAIRYAVNAVVVMHDLVWQKAIFDEQERSLGFGSGQDS